MSSRFSIIDSIRDCTSYAEAAERHKESLSVLNPGTTEERLREIVQGDLAMLSDYAVAYREDMLSALDLIEFNRNRGRVCAEWVWLSAGTSAGLAFAAKEELRELEELDRRLNGF